MKRSELFFAFLLVPLDILMILAAFASAYLWRANLESYLFSDIGLKEYFRYAFYLLPVWLLLMASNSLYTIRGTSGFFHQVYRILIASSTAILFLIVIIFMTKSLFFSRLILISTWVFAIIYIFLGRLLLQSIQKYLLRFDIGVRNVALIGNDAISDEIAEKFSGNRSSGYKIIGFLNGWQKSSGAGVKYLGPIDNIALLIKKYRLDEVILTDSDASKKEMAQVIRICYNQKVAFKYVPDVFGLLTSSFRPVLMDSIPLMELKSIPLDGWGRIIKRIGDIVFSALFLMILSPVILIVSILIKISSKGPMIYVHKRISRDGKTFNFYKFRSMYIEKCDYGGGTEWTTEEDETTRVTSFGRILRKTNLDELPQLWNILIGDMSFVGPRPEQPKLVKKFEQKIPDYFKRHKVRSGLTGWAQVNGLKGDTSVAERVEYDIYYIENWSIWLDLKIIIKTLFLIIYETFTGKSEYRSRP